MVTAALVQIRAIANGLDEWHEQSTRGQGRSTICQHVLGLPYKRGTVMEQNGLLPALEQTIISRNRPTFPVPTPIRRKVAARKRLRQESSFFQHKCLND